MKGLYKTGYILLLGFIYNFKYIMQFYKDIVNTDYINTDIILIHIFRSERYFMIFFFQTN